MLALRPATDVIIRKMRRAPVSEGKYPTYHC